MTWATAFYREWLDPSMTYSSALYAKRRQRSRKRAGRQYRALAQDTGIGPSDHVLEIGCGWGGFAEFAAREIGCKVTGLTISREQHDFARERIQKAGLADKVDIKFQDYRDETGRYDRIASIEMFEAVGEKHWPVFFSKMKECMRTGGSAGLQIITIKNEAFDAYRARPDFIQRYVFPGGMLPSPERLKSLGDQFGPDLTPATASSRMTMPARSPNGASASGPPGTRSGRSASTSASSGCGSSTCTIARPASAPATSTCGRWSTGSETGRHQSQRSGLARLPQVGLHADICPVDDLAQREGRVDARHMRHRRQPFLVNALVVLQILGRDAQDVVVTRPTSDGTRQRWGSVSPPPRNSASVFSNWPDSEMCTIAVIR